MYKKWEFVVLPITSAAAFIGLMFILGETSTFSFVGAILILFAVLIGQIRDHHDVEFHRRSTKRKLRREIWSAASVFLLIYWIFQLSDVTIAERYAAVIYSLSIYLLMIFYHLKKWKRFDEDEVK
ncbi:hypothetical protein [Falsibacillus albus]|uniref:DUF2178 domain-containing protein n=1 Tax=Falsibacillus albus TaxID=2478915 RepID=A0A3L7JVK0_9BACI|nr:hypothetical protein [Falsibacillus albus]RLQ94335.1 hypothetical protein D9X91_14875 [Falsibacillus albus]